MPDASGIRRKEKSLNESNIINFDITRKIGGATCRQSKPLNNSKYDLFILIT